MRSLRRRLSWMSAAWLVFQLVGTAAPVLAATGFALEEACTCPGGVHATTCPMHHGGGPAKPGQAHGVAPKDAKSRCAMTNAYEPTDLALLALAGGAGLLPHLTTLAIVEHAGTHLARQIEIRSSRSELPDSPPPRA